MKAALLIRAAMSAAILLSCIFAPAAAYYGRPAQQPNDVKGPKYYNAYPAQQYNKGSPNSVVDYAHVAGKCKVAKYCETATPGSALAEAVAAAVESANTATESANTAAQSANTAAQSANEALDVANDALNVANEALEAAGGSGDTTAFVEKFTECTTGGVNTVPALAACQASNKTCSRTTMCGGDELCISYNSTGTPYAFCTPGPRCPPGSFPDVLNAKLSSSFKVCQGCLDPGCCSEPCQFRFEECLGACQAAFPDVDIDATNPNATRCKVDCIKEVVACVRNCPVYSTSIDFAFFDVCRQRCFDNNAVLGPYCESWFPPGSEQWLLCLDPVNPALCTQNFCMQGNLPKPVNVTASCEAYVNLGAQLDCTGLPTRTLL
jgi:hypothetical protein